MMNKIKWCVGKKEGLSLIEPNVNLAGAYLKKAEDALNSIHLNVVRDWKISTAYYSVYFSLYAILMKLGVKCEIHSCTVAFAKRFLGDYFDVDDFLFIEDSLKARVDSQYYVDRTVPDLQFNRMIEKSPEFFVKCKGIIVKLNEKKINELRVVFKEELR